MIEAEHAEILAEQFPDLPRYAGTDGRVKLSAAWMLERLGLRGRRDGNVGFYDRHSLVLVNHGGATGQELLAFAERANDEVENAFGFRLEPEVLVL